MPTIALPLGSSGNIINVPYQMRRIFRESFHYNSYSEDVSYKSGDQPLPHNWEDYPSNSFSVANERSLQVLQPGELIYEGSHLDTHQDDTNYSVSFDFTAVEGLIFEIRSRRIEGSDGTDYVALETDFVNDRFRFKEVIASAITEYEWISHEFTVGQYYRAGLWLFEDAAIAIYNGAILGSQLLSNTLTNSITLDIENGDRDAQHTVEGLGWSSNTTTLEMQNSFIHPAEEPWLQFRISIPENADISSADLKLTSAATMQRGSGRVDVIWVDEYSNSLINYMTPTELSSIRWHAVGEWNTLDETHSVNIGDLLRQFINRTTYREGDYFTIKLRPEEGSVSRLFYAFEHATGQAPQLEIEYETPISQNKGFSLYVTAFDDDLFFEDCRIYELIDQPMPPHSLAGDGSNLFVRFRNLMTTEIENVQNENWEAFKAAHKLYIMDRHTGYRNSDWWWLGYPIHEPSTEEWLKP